MTEADLAPEITIWTDGTTASTAASVVELLGEVVRPIAVGGDRVGPVNDLARTLNCPSFDDLRKLLVDHPAAYLLLTTMEGVTLEELRAAQNQGTTVLTMEPTAGDLQELAAATGARNARGSDTPPVVRGKLLRIPTFAQSPGMLKAASPQEVLGNRRMLAYESIGATATGSLFARLFDAWLTVLAFTDLPESIDASLLGPTADPPDHLRDIAGRVAAHARMSDGSTALVAVADQTGRSHRRLQVIGDTGTLRIWDGGYELYQADGTLADQDSPGTAMGFAELVAAQWRRLIDRPNVPTGDSNPHADANAMACCQTCLLSARTGQPENPRKILEMNR